MEHSTGLSMDFLNLICFRFEQKIRLIVTIDDDVKSLREKMIIEQKKLNEVYL